MKIVENKVIKTSRNDEPNGTIVELFKHRDKTEVYLSTIYPHKFKGWHLHTKQTIRMTCIVGTILVSTIDPKTNYKRDFSLLSSNPQTLEIEPGFVIGVFCVGNEEAKIIVYPDPPYDPEDNEQEEYIDEGNK